MTDSHNAGGVDHLAHCLTLLFVVNCFQMSRASESKPFVEELIFDVDAPPNEPLNEGLREICVYTDLNPTEKKTKLEEEWNLRMKCTQEWFIRCSSINKYLFLELLCKSTSGMIALESVLKSIESIFSKDVLESNSEKSTSFAYDKFPADDNRALGEEDLNRAMKEGFVWFLNMDYSNQVRVILRLLRLGGGGLIFVVYKLAGKIFAERHAASEYITLLQAKGSNDTRHRLSSRAEEGVLVNRDSVSECSGSLKESILRKQSQLERRSFEFLNYKKLRGILDEDGNAPKDAETVDYLQILPIGLNRRIMSYIDEKTLSGLKKVGRYWSKMIDESINEKSVRKAINAKINKIIGIKVDKEERRREEKGKREELQLIKELGAKELINAKHENEKTLFALQERYKDIFSSKSSIKTLDTVFYPDRCGACDTETWILACSTPNNFVYFYSLRTGARFNFMIFGLDSSITYLTLHKDNIHIFIGCRNGSIVCKDFRTNNTTATFKAHTDDVLSIYTTLSNFLSASKDNTVKYFQLWTGICLLCINLNAELHISSALLRNDKSHVTAIGTEQGILVLANVWSKTLMSKVMLHNDEIKQLAHDEELLITGSETGKIRVWNMNRWVGSKKPQPYYNISVESPVTCLKFYEKQIFCGCRNGTIKIIPLATGKISRSLSVQPESPIKGLGIIEDKTVLKLVIWHEMGAEIREFTLQKPPPKKPPKEKSNYRSGHRKSKYLESKRPSETVTDDYIRNVGGSSETVPGVFKMTTYEGTKLPLNDRCCTISTLRIEHPKSNEFKTDIFAEVYNAGTSNSKGFLLCTFPRFFNVNSQ